MRMTDMGMKRGDMSKAECALPPPSDKDWKREKVYPEIHVSGPMAVRMGASELKAGERFRQVVEWEVRRHVAREENGKTEYELTLCMVQASDQEPVEKKEKGDDDSDGDDSLSYVLANAKGDA